MTKPDPNQIAVANLTNQVFNLPAFVRGQCHAVRAQLTMINASAEQKTVLGADAVIIEAVVAGLETAADAAEAKLDGSGPTPA